MISGQMPQMPGWGQVIPAVGGLVAGLFDSGREDSLRRYAEDLMRSRLASQDNVMQEHAALARRNFDESVARRRAFYEGEVATSVRNLNQQISATGAGPGSDTRNDVFNAVLAAEGERAFNQDYDRLSQQYLADLMQIQRPDVGSAVDVGSYAFPVEAAGTQAHQGGINAILTLGGLIGRAIDASAGGGQQPARPARPGRQASPYTPGDLRSYYDSIFDMQYNDNLNPRPPRANYFRWDAGPAMDY